MIDSHQRASSVCAQLNATAAIQQRGENEPRRMMLLSWERIDKGALIGRAAVRLPNQLEVSGIGIFQSGDARWAQMPSEPMRDAAGQVLRDERGKTRYRSPIKWANRSLQERFSTALIELVESAHGPIGGAA